MLFDASKKLRGNKPRKPAYKLGDRLGSLEVAKEPYRKRLLNQPTREEWGYLVLCHECGTEEVFTQQRLIQYHKRHPIACAACRKKIRMETSKKRKIKRPAPTMDSSMASMKW